ESPADKAMNFKSPTLATRLGIVLLAGLPFPSAPDEPAPQQYAVESTVSAQVCASPALTVTHFWVTGIDCRSSSRSKAALLSTTAMTVSKPAERACTTARL